MTVKVAVICYSATGTVQGLAQAVAEGARDLRDRVSGGSAGEAPVTGVRGSGSGA